jgi:L-ascorbate metabolism protein UlaG (beta-lactamase superfamily)
LLRWTRLRDITELRWGETKVLTIASQTKGNVAISAFQVKHWGARTQRGYNAYLIERNGRHILFGGDTAMTNSFAKLRHYGQIDLAVMSVGAYNHWIQSHRTPEQAVEMANAAGAQFIMPVHHQTFRLSFEPFREPIERFQAVLSNTPERIALREIGETFVLPL